MTGGAPIQLRRGSTMAPLVTGACDTSTYDGCSSVWRHGNLSMPQIGEITAMLRQYSSSSQEEARRMHGSLRIWASICRRSGGLVHEGGKHPAYVLAAWDSVEYLSSVRALYGHNETGQARTHPNTHSEAARYVPPTWVAPTCTI